jgi:hypothetical protein
MGAGHRGRGAVAGRVVAERGRNAGTDRAAAVHGNKPKASYAQVVVSDAWAAVASAQTEVVSANLDPCFGTSTSLPIS